ncbi:MAG TPA: zinc ribbon domain-containing protein [Usitatibacter sp.]|nr:zinc ribbon domain-containing protein [Usitatibacter sp.]
MPIYEYRCESCGHQQEFLQKVSDAPLTVCPECGKPTFKKMVTAAGFQLKGSGWYVTDFRNKSSSKPAAKNESKGDSTSGESKGSESKGSESKSGGDAKPTESKPAESKPTTPSKPAASSGDA